MLVLTACGGSGTSLKTINDQIGNSSEVANMEVTAHQIHEATESDAALTDIPDKTAAEQTEEPSTPKPDETKGNVSRTTSKPAKSEGSSGGSTPTTPKPTVSPTAKPASVTHVVEIEDFAYSIAELEIKVGDKVTFINRDKMAHTATADDNSFDTGLLGEGEKKDVTFDTKGDFSYYCTPHPGMKALIRVTAG